MVTLALYARQQGRTAHLREHLEVVATPEQVVRIERLANAAAEA